eukprot:732284-Rhodomonas_salina.1
MLGLRLVMLLCMAVALSTGLLIPVQTPLHQISSTHRGFCSHSFGSLGLRKAFSSSVALRMSDDDAEKSKQDELAALVKERDQLQKETDELMKRRQELLKQDVAKLMNKPSEAKESSPAAAQPALEKKDATAPKNEPFELFAKAKDTKMEAGTGEAKKTTRGGFLRAVCVPLSPSVCVRACVRACGRKGQRQGERSKVTRIRSSGDWDSRHWRDSLCGHHPLLPQTGALGVPP